MSTYAPSPKAYRQSAVLTAPPSRLVVLLYDGARRFLSQASVAMQERKIEAAHWKLRRAETIIQHLNDTLDLEQGEVATRLQMLYLFCARHLNQARVQQDPKKVEEVSELLAELREAWDAIASG